MTPEQRIVHLEAELAEARRVISDQARALAEHAVREAQETAKRESRARINRQNYERRKAVKAAQTSDSDASQTLNAHPPSPSPPPSFSLSPPSTPSPSILYPFSPASPPSASASAVPDDPPGATDHAEAVSERPPLELVSPTGGKTPREPSKAERLYAVLQSTRAERCAAAGAVFVDDGWKPARINRDLGPLARVAEGSHDARLLNAAWEEYLADDARAGMDVPWSLGYFLASRAQWEGRALKATGGAL